MLDIRIAVANAIVSGHFGFHVEVLTNFVQTNIGGQTNGLGARLVSCKTAGDNSQLRALTFTIVKNTAHEAVVTGLYGGSVVTVIVVAIFMTIIRRRRILGRVLRVIAVII